MKYQLTLKLIAQLFVAIFVVMTGACTSPPQQKIYTPTNDGRNSTFTYAHAQCEVEALTYHAPVQPYNPRPTAYTCNTYGYSTTCKPSSPAMDLAGAARAGQAAAHAQNVRGKIYDACMLRHGWQFSHYDEVN